MLNDQSVEHYFPFKEHVGKKKMKIGIVIYSKDPETVWNAFRLADFALKEGDTVKAFLLAKGVESESLDIEQFKVTRQMQCLVEGRRPDLRLRHLPQDPQFRGFREVSPINIEGSLRNSHTE
jgi:hypothetical protein